MIKMTMDNTYFYEMENASGYKFWAWPKYDGRQYDEATLRAFANAFSPRSSAVCKDESWRFLGMRTGDGKANYHERKLLFYSRHYTLLTLAPSGAISESHQDSANI